MDMVFVDTTSSTDTPYRWPITWERNLLLDTLKEAAQRSQSTHRSVLTSFVAPISSYDAVRVYAAVQKSQMDECFFWETPAEKLSLVGIGNALSLSDDSHKAMHVLADQWRHVLDQVFVRYAPGEIDQACSGPLFFGGFAFDPLHTRTQIWHDFPAGLLCLPEILISHREDRSMLTINTLVHTTDDPVSRVDALFQKVRLLQKAIEQISPDWEQPTEPRILQQEELLPASVWQEIVAQTVAEIQAGDYSKAVMARAVRFCDPLQPFRLEMILYQLRRNFSDTHIFAFQQGESHFVGATPERLVLTRSGRVQTMALAGTAPRGQTPEEDRHLGDELLQSLKNSEEHAIVVERIRASLAELCERAYAADTPLLLRLRNLQHLETPIFGELKPGRNLLDAVALLHPTPAVGGEPRQPALEAIRDHEHLDRGWYAGPIGWVGPQGDGEFAVALRSGLIHGSEAMLYAGCGIVADSDPHGEYQETLWKLQAMLRGLNAI